MLRRGIQFFVLVAVGAASTISPACASSVTYSDPTSFGAASTNISLITFEDLGSGTHFYNNASGLTDGPSGNLAQFVGWDGSSYTLDADNVSSGGGNWAFWGPISPNTVLHASGGASSYLQINLPSNITAFGLDVMTAFSFAQNVTITLADGEVFNNIATQNNPAEQFWGVTTDSPIAYVRVQAPTAGSLLIDNVEFGQANGGSGGGGGGGGGSDPGDTPEGMTFLLMGMGLVLMRGIRKFGLPMHNA